MAQGKYSFLHLSLLLLATTSIAKLISSFFFFFPNIILSFFFLLYFFFLFSSFLSPFLYLSSSTTFSPSSSTPPFLINFLISFPRFMFHLFVSLSCFPRYLLYSTSEIKELFISSTETTVYSQLLPSASSLVRNKANTSETLTDSVSNVMLCGGSGQVLSVKYMYSVSFSLQCTKCFKPCVTL